jgi:hypothetical protein
MLRILLFMRVRVRVVWIAAATRVEHRDAALACLMVDSATARPVRGLHCPDVRGRMLRNLLAWIGSLRIGSHARKKAARSLSRHEDFARVPMQRSGRIVQEIVLMDRICGREKEKPPDGYPRAFACLGDRGDRSPEKGSAVVCVVAAPHTPIAAILRQRACVRIAMEARRVERVGGVGGGFHRRTRLEFVVFRQR